MNEPNMMVRVEDQAEGTKATYFLSRDNWRHEWAATTEGGAVVMWVPKALMEEHVTAVVTCGRRWVKVINNERTV